MSLTLSGLFALILTQILGDTVPQEQIANFIEVAGLIITSLVIWYGRIRNGGLKTWWGKK